MPKTLAALPRSQYATDLELVSGKNFLLDALSPLLMVWLSEVNGDATGVGNAPLVCESGIAVLLYRMFGRSVDFAVHLDERGASAFAWHW